jgi:hypothetical protein
MKDLLPVLAVIAGALALIAAAVFGAGDADLFVPPPEAVAESFARQLVTSRYDLATKYLSTGLRRRVDAAGLRHRYEPMRKALGKINQVEAETESRSAVDAVARASVHGDGGTAPLRMRLVREHGLWVLGALPGWP